MEETGDVAGVQIHRSHWVALEAVARTFRMGIDGGRWLSY
jgi:DNA-binding LytR/AlgR family response regulator